MGYVSYQEDNLDAIGESVKRSLRVQTKETKVVKKELPIYEFEGKPLTQYVAETILMQWAERETHVRREKPLYLTMAKWAEYLRAYHEKKGG